MTYLDAVGFALASARNLIRQGNFSEVTDKVTLRRLANLERCIDKMEESRSDNKVPFTESNLIHAQRAAEVAA